MCQFYAEKLLHVCNNIFEHGVDANSPASPPPFQQLCCTVEVKVTGAISGCELVYRNCDYGVSAAIWVQYKNNHSGCKLVTLFDSYCDSGVNIPHKCGKSGGKLVTLFDSNSYDGVSAGIYGSYIQVPNLGASC